MRFSNVEPILLGIELDFDAQFPAIVPTIQNIIETGQYKKKQFLIIDRALMLYELFRITIGKSPMANNLSVRESLRYYLNVLLTYAERITRGDAEDDLNILISKSLELIPAVERSTIASEPIKNFVSWFELYEPAAAPQSTSGSAAPLSKRLVSPLAASIAVQLNVYPQITGLLELLWPIETAVCSTSIRGLIMGLKSVISARLAELGRKKGAGVEETFEEEIIRFQKPLEFLKLSAIFLRTHYSTHSKYLTGKKTALRHSLTVLPGQKTLHTVTERIGEKTTERMTSNVVDKETETARKAVMEKLSEGSEAQKHATNTKNNYETTTTSLTANVGGGYGPIHANVGGSTTGTSGQTTTETSGENKTARQLAECTKESVAETNTSREKTVSLSVERSEEKELAKGQVVEYTNTNQAQAIMVNGYQTASIYEYYILITGRDLLFSNGLELIEKPAINYSSINRFVEQSYRPRFTEFITAEIEDVVGNKYALGTYKNQNEDLKKEAPWGVPIFVQTYEIAGDAIESAPGLNENELVDKYLRKRLELEFADKQADIDRKVAETENVKKATTLAKTEYGVSAILISQGTDYDKNTKFYLMGQVQFKQPLSQQIIDNENHR